MMEKAISNIQYSRYWPKLSKGKCPSFDLYACRNNICKACILRIMPGKRSRDTPGMKIRTKLTRTSLEENVRLTEDRTAWRERSCAAGAANVRTDDAD